MTDLTSPRSPAPLPLEDEPQEGSATKVDGDRQPLLVLRGLEGNPPAGELNATQKLLAPHVDAIILFWWIVWFATLGLMLWRTFVRPLLSRLRGKREGGGAVKPVEDEKSNARGATEPATTEKGESR